MVSNNLPVSGIYFCVVKSSSSASNLCPDSSDASIYYASRNVFIAVYVDDTLIFGLDEASCNDVYEVSQPNSTCKTLVILLHSLVSTLFATNRRSRSIKSAISNECYHGSTLPTHERFKHLSTRRFLSSKLNQTTNVPTNTYTKKSLGPSTTLPSTVAPTSRSQSPNSQFLTDPSETHMTAARHVLRYLKYTIPHCITYRRAQNLNILGYADADWGSDENDRISFIGYVFMI
jgi:hypothetical protein